MPRKEPRAFRRTLTLDPYFTQAAAIGALADKKQMARVQAQQEAEREIIREALDAIEVPD